jgi:hypothetical protein
MNDDSSADSTPVDVRATARAELDRRRHELVALRAERDRLNDVIRARVAELDTHASVVRLLDKRAPVEEQAARPLRRRGARARQEHAEHVAGALQDRDTARDRVAT